MNYLIDFLIQLKMLVSKRIFFDHFRTNFDKIYWILKMLIIIGHVLIDFVVTLKNLIGFFIVILDNYVIFWNLALGQFYHITLYY